MAEAAGPAEADRARPGRSAVGSLAAIGLIVLAIVPVVSSAVEIGHDWVPQGDNAFITLRADDAFTRHAPVLGMPSTVGDAVGEPVHHPGPLESQVIGLLALTTDDVRAPLVAVSLVNLASVVVVLAWARRLGGLRLLAVAAPAMAVLLWSLRGPILVTPFNPYVAVLPLLAAIVSLIAVWSRLAWGGTLAVLFGSWAAQAHLTASGPMLAAAGTVVAVVVARWIRERRAGATPLHRRRLAIAVAVGLTCWVLPLLEALTNRGGNLRALLHVGGELGGDTLGAESALHVLVNALAPRPVWAQAGAGPLDLLRTPSPAAQAGAAALVLVAGGVAVRHRRTQPAVTAGVVIPIASLVLGGLLTARIPGAFGNVFAITNYLWLWPVSAVLWVATGVGAARIVAPSIDRALRRRVRCHAAVATTAVALVVTAVVATASLGEPHRSAEPTPAYVHELLPSLIASLDPEVEYLMEVGQGFEAFDLSTGLLVGLDRAGFDVRVPPAHRAALGDHRVGEREGRAVLVVHASRDRPAPRAGALAVATYAPPAELVQRRARAEQALVEQIVQRGGTSLPDGRFIAPEEAGEWVRSGGFVQAAAFRIVDPELAGSPAGRELMAERAEPLRVVTVYLLD